MKFRFNIVRAACEVSSGMWNLCTNSAFAVGPRETLIDSVGGRTFRT
jgi:hypothetical protein